MVVSDDNQRAISKRSRGEGVMDSHNVSIADTLPGLDSSYRILISQSEACSFNVSVWKLGQQETEFLPSRRLRA
jgi:hypothetical protein